MGEKSGKTRKCVEMRKNVEKRGSECKCVGNEENAEMREK